MLELQLVGCISPILHGTPNESPKKDDSAFYKGYVQSHIGLGKGKHSTVQTQSSKSSSYLQKDSTHSETSSLGPLALDASHVSLFLVR